MRSLFHKQKSPTLQVQEWLDLIYASSNDWSKDITCPMHTANDSPPAPTDTLLGWKSIFTTSEALETNKRGYLCEERKKKKQQPSSCYEQLNCKHA